MKHRITWLETAASFDADGDEPVLAAALRAGIALPHDCRLGGCGSCRVKLLSGAVGYAEWPFALSQDEHEQGLALACQALARCDLVISVAAVAQRQTEPVRASARVLVRRQVAPQVSVLRLALDATSSPAWHPGQHLDILLPDGTRRSFSMANPAGGGEIELHIRHIEGGRFTSGALPRLCVGQTIEVELPRGSFRLRLEDELPLLLVATGTGIAPLKCMLDAMCASGDAPPAMLYWGTRQREEQYLEREVAEWAGRLFEFRHVPVLSRPDAVWSGRRGHVQQAVLADVPDLSGHAIYLCGSPAMVHDASRAFIERGADAQRLYTDSFLFQHDAGQRREPTVAAPAA